MCWNLGRRGVKDEKKPERSGEVEAPALMIRDAQAQGIAQKRPEKPTLDAFAITFPDRWPGTKEC